MRYTLTGSISDLFSFGFLDATFRLTAGITDQVPTEMAYFNSANGAVVRLLGTKLPTGQTGFSNGIVTEIVVTDRSGRDVGTITDITWNLRDLLDAVDAIAEDGDLAPIAALINAEGPLTVDLTGIEGFVDIEDDLENLLPLLAGPITLRDGGHNADIAGSGTDDTILLRGTPDRATYVFLEATEGDDTVDASGVGPETFLEIDFDQDFSDRVWSIDAHLDGPANTATIDMGSSSLEITGVDRLMRLADGVSILGSRQGDRFEVHTSEESYVNVLGGEGKDSYDLTVEADALLRLSFNFGANESPFTGVKVDLTDGTILNDGYGNIESLIVAWRGGSVELRGTVHGDRLTGSAHDDAFRPVWGNDTVDGRAGIDRVSYYFEDVDIDANLAQGRSRVFDEGTQIGTTWLTSIETLGGSNIGDDTLIGSADDDRLLGFGGADSQSGGDGADTLEGWAGEDTLAGGLGDDLLEGHDGDDLLRGNTGSDTLYGGHGNDLLRGQSEGDYLDGFDGDDNIKGGGGNDTLLGGDGRDFLNGGTRRDSLDGGDGNDILIGRSFDDTLRGGASDDILNGGGENDVLEGGSGNDFLKGGAGADVFVFDLGFETDRVADFGIADDRLEISAALAQGRDAAGIAALAVTGSGATEIDFGGGDVIRLLGLTDTTGLESRIDIL